MESSFTLWKSISVVTKHNSVIRSTCLCVVFCYQIGTLFIYNYYIRFNTRYIVIFRGSKDFIVLLFGYSNIVLITTYYKLFLSMVCMRCVTPGKPDTGFIFLWNHHS